MSGKDGSGPVSERNGARKVRAPRARITANGSRGRPQGKCNRDIPPHFAVRVERRGKSSPLSAVTQKACKPYPEQHRTEDNAPARRASQRWHFKLHGRPAAKIDCRHYRTRLIFRSQQKSLPAGRLFCCDLNRMKETPDGFLSNFFPFRWRKLDGLLILSGWKHKIAFPRKAVCCDLKLHLFRFNTKYTAKLYALANCVRILQFV